jgi:hypothetical protein
MWIKLAYTVGNALLTIGSVLSLGRRAMHFGKRVKYHDRPRYTKPRSSSTKKQNRS